MGKSVIILSNCLGLNNKVDPVRLRFDLEKGFFELAVALNVDIGSGFRINRRKGYTRVVSGRCHSLFPYENEHLVVKDGMLSILDSEYSCKGILEVDQTAKISYASGGKRIYFTNGYQKGYVEESIAYPWEFVEYVGTTTTRVYEGPPLGHMLEIYNGFMFIAQDNILWYSRPFAYHAFCLRDGYFIFDSRIRMLRSVKDGLYVGTENKVYYLKGFEPKQFFQFVITDYPVIEGTDTLIDGRKIEGEEIMDNVVIWTNKDGICIGGPDGMFKNLTEGRLVLPDSGRGAGTYINDRYICTWR